MLLVIINVPAFWCASLMHVSVHLHMYMFVYAHTLPVLPPHPGDYKDPSGILSASCSALSTRLRAE